MSQKVLFHLFFILQLGLCHARISLTPFGEGYIEQGPCLCFHEYGALTFSPFNWAKCTSYSVGWWKICGLSTKCYSCSCQAQIPALIPHKKQYPLKPEVKEWTKSYSTDFSWCDGILNSKIKVNTWLRLRFSSVQFSYSVVSDSLWPHELIRLILG